MSFVYWFIGGVIVLLLLLIVYGIAKASGMGEYKTTLIRCKKCKHFINGNPQIREIFCEKQGAIVVELADKCKLFEEK